MTSSCSPQTLVKVPRFTFQSLRDSSELSVMPRLDYRKKRQAVSFHRFQSSPLYPSNCAEAKIIFLKYKCGDANSLLKILQKLSVMQSEVMLFGMIHAALIWLLLIYVSSSISREAPHSQLYALWLEKSLFFFSLSPTFRSISFISSHRFAKSGVATLIPSNVISL